METSLNIYDYPEESEYEEENDDIQEPDEYDAYIDNKLTEEIEVN